MLICLLVYKFYKWDIYFTHFYILQKTNLAIINPKYTFLLSEESIFMN